MSRQCPDRLSPEWQPFACEPCQGGGLPPPLGRPAARGKRRSRKRRERERLDRRRNGGADFRRSRRSPGDQQGPRCGVERRAVAGAFRLRADARLGAGGATAGAGAELPDGFAILGVAGRYAGAIPLAETLLAGWLLSRAGLRPPGGAMSGRPRAVRANRITLKWRRKALAVRRAPGAVCAARRAISRWHCGRVGPRWVETAGLPCLAMGLSLRGRKGSNTGDVRTGLRPFRAAPPPGSIRAEFEA